MTRRLVVRLSGAVLAAMLATSAPGWADGPREGTWYGGDPDRGAVLFDVGSRGGDTVISRVRHWAFANGCRGVDSLESGSNSRARMVVGRDGRFRNEVTPGTKVAITGRVDGGRVRIRLRPAQGTKAEVRCFTRRFTARPAGRPPLSAGAWRGSVAAQPAVDSFSGPVPAQPFKFKTEERGRMFAGGNEAIKLDMRCESEREPSGALETELFDISRPVSPDGVIAFVERTGKTEVRWALTATSRTTVEGTVRVRSENSRGDPCDSGEIPITAAR